MAQPEFYQRLLGLILGGDGHYPCWTKTVLLIRMNTPQAWSVTSSASSGRVEDGVESRRSQPGSYRKRWAMPPDVWI